MQPRARPVVWNSRVSAAQVFFRRPWGPLPRIETPPVVPERQPVGYTFDRMKLRPFQADFKRRAMAPGIDTAALSLPRGQREIVSRGRPDGRCVDAGRIRTFRKGRY